MDAPQGWTLEEGGEALVYEVVATKILAFAKGDFVQTRYRF